MSDLPVQKMMQWSAERTQSTVEFMMTSDMCGDTPIERALYAALNLYFRDYGYSHCHPERGKRLAEDVPCEYGEIAVEKQTEHGGFAVDFAFKCKSARGVVKWVIVECDGHDFHERTKEQAARDRARDRTLQRLGYVILRFTGREIWTDPMRCADEVISAISKICCDGMFDEVDP